MASPLDRRATIARLRDATAHLQRNPRHSLRWIEGEPHYCTAEHKVTEPHNWQPVPHYEDVKPWHT